MHEMFFYLKCQLTIFELKAFDQTLNAFLVKMSIDDFFQLGHGHLGNRGGRETRYLSSILYNIYLLFTIFTYSLFLAIFTNSLYSLYLLLTRYPLKWWLILYNLFLLSLYYLHFLYRVFSLLFAVYSFFYAFFFLLSLFIYSLLRLSQFCLTSKDLLFGCR